MKPSKPPARAQPPGGQPEEACRRHLSPEILRMYRSVLGEPESVYAVAQLAKAMGRSGWTRPTQRKAADIASTGGPSSLSTLLCPLHLVGSGFDVPKIGVPGRPAGGVDVLGTLRGFRTRLPAGDVDRCITTAGYVHIGADEAWAPADAALFALRQSEGTQAVPALAVASLLAKKLAAGVGVAGLEARIGPYGNFGASVEEGRRSAMLYCSVAVELGLIPIVILTDGRSPFQPYIGRGEALTALWRVVTHDLDDVPWLAEHAQLCLAMAGEVASRVREACAESRSLGPSPIEVLSAHLKAQGTSTEEVLRRIGETSQQQCHRLLAPGDGFVQYDLGRIRKAIGEIADLDAQCPRADVGSDFDDPAGVRLLCPPGRRVTRGETVIQLRSRSGGPTSSRPGSSSSPMSLGQPPTPSWRSSQSDEPHLLLASAVGPRRLDPR